MPLSIGQRATYAQVPIHVDDSWHISVPVTLNGKSLTAVIDSGADRSTMSMETLKDIFGIDEKNPALKQEGAASINGTAKTAIYRYPFGTLSLEGRYSAEPRHRHHSCRDIWDDNPQLIIGINVLKAASPLHRL